MPDQFEMHCVVELFGHNKIAGKVTEQAIGGATFIRIDVPKTTKREPFTKFFGPSAIYAITPVEESIAAAMAEALDEAPIQERRLRTIDASHQLSGPPPGRADGYEWPDDEDEERWPTEPSASPVDAPSSIRTLADKRAAAGWASVLLEGEFVIFDTETTGFGDDDEIIQIGIIDQAGAVVLDQLIKPTKPITNTPYHSLTDDLVKDAPAFPDVYEQIKAAFEGKTVLAYNLDYDHRMLSQVCRRHNLEIIALTESHCVMEQFAQFYGQWNDYHGNYRWKKLRDAVAHFDLAFEGEEHNAVVDCKATLAVIQKMAEWISEPVSSD